MKKDKQGEKGVIKTIKLLKVEKEITRKKILDRNREKHRGRKTIIRKYDTSSTREMERTVEEEMVIVCRSRTNTK